MTAKNYSDVFYRLELADASSTAKPLRILLPGTDAPEAAQGVTVGRDALQCSPNAVLRCDADARSLLAVSRTHCVLRWHQAAGAWTVVDLSSKGCFVNGAKVHLQKLLQ